MSYKIYFSVSNFSLLLLDYIFRSESYGSVDYVVLNEKNIIRGYLSEDSFKDAYKLSRELLDEKFSKNLLKNLNILNNKIINFKLPVINDKNVEKEWIKFTELLNEFCIFYMYCEQPFQQALEEILVNKFKNSEKLNNVLINPESAKRENFSDIEMYALKLLFDLGKIKLKLHINQTLINNLNILSKFVAKKNNISFNQVQAMRGDEFLKVIRGEKPNLDLINKRLKGFALLKKNEKWLCLIGEEFKLLKNKIQSVQSNDILGFTAYPGKVRGKAVIHLSWTDVTNVPEGSILVAGMTNPQMLPYIKKAVAIVTDEGGLTCHAAIISRELKKPCIVGTGNATSLIKNGDEIEVDANNGIVKILNIKK